MADHAIPGLGPGLYGEWRAADIGVTTDRIEQVLILELAGNVAGLRALDVRCGDGELALKLWERGAEVTDVRLHRNGRGPTCSAVRSTSGKVTAVPRELGELLVVATIAVLTQGC